MDEILIDAPAETAPLRPATVAVVGRPNVGKSALFNRLIGRRLAIVEDTPGVTRDRLYALCEWTGRTFTLVDTAGIDPELETGETAQIALGTRRQAEAAALAADVVLFIVDAQDGAHPLDVDVAAILRKNRRKVILVANKAESVNASTSAHAEFAALGFGDPAIISAIHGEGIGDLLDRIIEALPPDASGDAREGELSLAIIGRPNVGKSSLLNSLLGEERVVVSDIPGTTRDAIDTLFTWKGKSYRLIDTAGVNRKSNQHGPIEYYSALRSISAIGRADIALLVFDSMRGLTLQDRRLAGMVIEEGKGLIIVGNKWDLAREQGEYQQGDLINVLHEQMPFARFAPVTFLSALTKRRLNSLMPIVEKVAENLDRRIPTAQLNELVRMTTLTHPAPAVAGKLFKIYFASQPAVHPPKFLFFCNDPDLVPHSYVRFLDNTLREHGDFEGVPLQLEFRPRRSADSDE